MATVNKNFRVKDGLVVEGTTGTINGSDILTANAIAGGTQNNITVTYNANSKTLDFAVEALNIDTNGPITFNNGILDVATGEGIRVDNQALAVNYGNGLTILAGEQIIVDFDVVASKSYADSAYTDADARAALSAGDGINYSNGLISVSAFTLGGITVGNGSVEIDRNIVDTWYDANGAAATAESNANDYTDTAVSSKQNTLTAGLAISSSDLANNIISVSYANGLTRDGNGKLVVDTDVIASKTYVDGLATNYDAAGAAANALSDAQAYTDSRINDGVTSNVKTWSSTKINSEITTAVSGLVDGAPELLNTLNELAAAINDDESFATTVSTQIGNKQNSFTAGDGLEFVGNNTTLQANVDDVTIVAGGSLGFLRVNYDNALTISSANSLTVNTDIIASVDYVDTNFVNVADLPGQLDDYILATQKGAIDGVATLDGNGQVPSSQLGNVPAAYVTSVGDNLSVTNGELNIDATPIFTAVDFNSVAKQVAAKIDTIGSNAVTLYSFKIGPYSDAYTSAEYTVASYATKSGVPSNTYEREITKIMLTTDNGGNVAITEYGTVTLNDSVLNVSAEIVTVGTIGMNGYYQCNLIASSATSGVTVDHATVVGTLFK